MMDKNIFYIIIDDKKKIKVLQRDKKNISFKIIEGDGKYGKIIISGIKYDITYDKNLFGSIKYLNNRIERLIK